MNETDKKNNDNSGDRNGSGIADGKAQRQLIAAYLSSAREEVAVLSPTGLRLLEMTIASLTNGVTVNVVEQTSQSVS
jgi:hypothetical protein